MITQTGYLKLEIKFGCQVLLCDPTNDDDYGVYHRFFLVLVSENTDSDINILDSLNPDNDIYEPEQADYIRRYQKFNKFVEENKGKQFIAVIPSFVTNNYRSTTGILNIFNNDFFFNRSMRIQSNSDLSFLTDYELIPIEYSSSITKLEKILESVVISKINKPLWEHNYQGRNVT